MYVILQQHLFDSLRAGTERLPHALLLHGPQGIGKLELAEHFAQWLLCEAPIDEKAAACGRCDACRWFLAGSHPDFRRVEPEGSAARTGDDGAEAPAERPERISTEIKIGQIRELSDFLYIGSHRGRRRIALVYPAEEMNSHAANSLLKGLEEPPPNVVFLLVAHRAARLPATVRSRCVSVAVAAPGPEEARAWLAAREVPNAERWLAFCAGAPVRALEYAQGESGTALAQMLEALAREDLDALLAAAAGRAELALLVEVLQRYALDRALVAGGCGAARFGTPTGKKNNGAGAAAWLGLAREVGRYRRLARHPLNPGLLGWDLVDRLRGCLNR